MMDFIRHLNWWWLMMSYFNSFWRIINVSLYGCTGYQLSTWRYIWWCLKNVKKSYLNKNFIIVACMTSPELSFSHITFCFVSKENVFYLKTSIETKQNYKNGHDMDVRISSASQKLQLGEVCAETRSDRLLNSPQRMRNNDSDSSRDGRQNQYNFLFLHFLRVNL